MTEADNSRFVWIKTQDGSPTLWNNDIGEPYRSVKGAFHESLLVFVKPAIEFAQKIHRENPRELVVGEFGLGAGTNWLFFSAIAKSLGIPFKYYAIEKDRGSFDLALKKWPTEKALIEENIHKHLGQSVNFEISELRAPEIFASLDDFTTAFQERSLLCDIWFHDPFGSGVNPEGYSEETLKQCSISWAANFIGLSYACNGAFQRALKAIEVSTQVRELNSPPLKKESLTFFRQLFDTV